MVKSITVKKPEENKPEPLHTTHTTVNKDGSYTVTTEGKTVTTEGKTVNLSANRQAEKIRREMGSFSGVRDTSIPNVQEPPQQAESESAKQRVADIALLEANPKTAGAAGAAGAARGITGNAVANVPENNAQMDALPTLESSTQRAQIAEDIPNLQKQVEQENRLKNVVTGQGEQSPQMAALAYGATASKEGIKVGLKLAVTGYDIYKQITGKKTVALTQTEDAFNQARGALRESIDSVKNRTGSFDSALENYNLAVRALAASRNIAKGKGRASVSYWRDNGMQMETMVAQETAILEGMRNDLIAAKASNEANSQAQADLQNEIAAAKQRLGQ